MASLTLFIFSEKLFNNLRSSFAKGLFSGTCEEQFFSLNANTLCHKLPKLLAKSLLIVSSSFFLEILPSEPKDTSLIK